MATQNITIIKASFAASLFKADPTSVTRDAIADFHALLQDTIATGSRLKIQACKAWLLDKVIPSSGRIAVFAKYLSAVAGSTVNDDASRNRHKNKVSPKRTRLHILYLVNDLLHHTKYHVNSPKNHAILSSNFQTQLVALVGAAGSFTPDKNKRHFRKLEELLSIWEKSEYYTSSYIAKLREAITNASDDPEALQNKDTPSSQKPAKRVPYVLPATHGDTTQRWHDLPAGNLLPHIMPDSAIPIDPKQVRPLQLTAGPANENMANIVMSFLQDVNSMPDRKREYTIWDEELAPDLDAMGHALVKQGDDGSMLAKENRYGWTFAFCEILKKRKRDGPQAARLPGDYGANQSMSRSLSPSRSRSRNRHSRGRSPDLRERPCAPRRKGRRNSSSSESSYSPSLSGSQTRHRSRTPPIQGHSSSSRPRSPANPHFQSAQQPPPRRDSGSAPPRRPQFLQAGQSPSSSYSPSLYQQPSYSPNNNQQSGYPPPPPPQQHQVQSSSHQHQQPSHPMHMPIPAPYSAFSTANAPLVTPTAQMNSSFPPPMVPPPPPQHGASYYQSAHNYPVDQNGLPLPPPPPFHKGPWPPPPPPTQQGWYGGGQGQRQDYGPGQNGTGGWRGSGQGSPQGQNGFAGGLPGRGGLGNSSRGGATGRGGIGSGRGC